MTLRIGLATVVAGCLGLAAGAPALAGSSAPVSTGTSLSARAPESAFHAAGSATSSADPASCTRPDPDGRVSTTIHCYTPDQIRAFYGLAPLTPATTDGAGQTIVLVDSYGSPTAANDVSFFAKTFHGPTPDFELVFPLGKVDYTHATGTVSYTHLTLPTN